MTDVFVVRVVREPGADQDPVWLRGVVEEVSTGLTAPFRDAEELLAFLFRPPASEAAPAAARRA